ncbi:MAG: OmpH family outer membrane protein [Phycisphaerales bacterium]|nr:OmpH family outer membrane protein [Planctomycetota bacterium]MBL6997331.1 OmpH family outer membrane protein [Phycisphaerales bacterium]
MQHVRNKTHHIYAIALLVVISMAWQSQANRKVAPATPAVLVSVDFERAFSSLEERVYEESKVQAFVAKLTEDIESKRLHIESYEQEFELYESGSDKWEELLQEQQLEVLEYQAQIEYRNIRAIREESKGMRRIYQHIREAAAELSKENGWDYVIVNDAAFSLPEGDNVDMGAQISSRRMLYANPSLDVTDILIEYMNASFDEMAVR